MKKLDNVLPFDLYDRMFNRSKTEGFTHGWKSNKDIQYTHFNHTFGGKATDNRVTCNKELPPDVLEVWEYIQSNHLPGTRLIRCYMNMMVFGTEGWPHVDSTRSDDVTFILYLVDDWKKEWGGETVTYLNEEIDAACLPKKNRAIIIDASQTHCARSVSRICDKPRVTLMFKATYEQDTAA